MKDLQSSRSIYLKGWMFLAILTISILLILIENFSWKLTILLALAIWSASRLYYLMFYVIEKYVDPTYRFSGIVSFVKYVVKRRK